MNSRFSVPYAESFEFGEFLPGVDITHTDQERFASDEAVFKGTLRFKSEVVLPNEMLASLDKSIITKEVVGRMRRDFEDQLLAWVGKVEQLRNNK